MANYYKKHREEHWRRVRRDRDSREVAERVNEAIGRRVAAFFVREAEATAPPVVGGV